MSVRSSPIDSSIVSCLYSAVTEVSYKSYKNVCATPFTHLLPNRLILKSAKQAVFIHTGNIWLTLTSQQGPQPEQPIGL